VTFTVKELAALSGGELVGDSTLKITGAASLGEATPGEISFFTNRKYIGLLRKTRASAIFVPPDFSEPISAAQIRVSNPTKAFEQVVLKFAPKPITFAPETHPSVPHLSACDNSRAKPDWLARNHSQWRCYRS